MGVAELVAVAEIEVLKSRYFRCVDSSDWVELRALFTDDATVTMPTYDAPKSADEAVASIARTLTARASVHTGVRGAIVIDTSGRAHAEWAMDDRLFIRDPRTDVRTDQRLIVGTGTYSETYRREHGVWLIESMRLERARVDLYGSIGSN